MSAGESGGRWLRIYPRAWRERYGQELQELILATSGDGPLPWRTRVDLVRAGLGERLRAFGFGGPGIPPAVRARAGVLLVLCSWALLLVGGGMLQRFSENWREVTPAADRGLPGVAYDTLIALATVAGLLVLAGIVCLIPRLLAFLRAGGWPELRGPVAKAAEASVLAVVATLALSLWAHQLDAAQRNGHDLAYELGFLLWGVAAVACLASWVVVAVQTATHLQLSERWWRVETSLATATSACMVAVVAATAVWWGALASAAPWALSDRPAGVSAPTVTVPLMLASTVMTLAVGLALAGAGTALRARAQLSR